ncbi:helix-turn-helix domain-containing protein [Paraburkholderia elongata]|uniref:Helix-turn-helix domain-containing protein n=1 Tax=Paraburkholderia elongata TaxID=2675747 RepID=A0A972NZP9_9BURK|nr:AraC family transcriptional regulator [Paraburkholderia elongata]NPT61449.1 helix-turn-helix domain-containing protein [Paraburkholderia elongata]
MNALIPPEEIVSWIPGELTLDSAPLAWDGMKLKGYRYDSLDVEIPTMRDYMIVAYKNRDAQMSRRQEGERWQSARVGPGVVSVLTRAAQSQWRWNKPIEVSHMYLSQAAVGNIAIEAFERDIKNIEMFDVVSSEDPVLSAVVANLAHELEQGGPGGKLYAEALKIQGCVHLLRNYASVAFREFPCYGGLTKPQVRVLMEFIETNIERNISLAELAAVTRLSTFHFTRCFRAEFGCPPHAYVMSRKLEHAKQLLGRKDVSLKAVAASSGFSDQSHMTRLFRRALNTTPAEYRRQITGLGPMHSDSEIE